MIKIFTLLLLLSSIFSFQITYNPLQPGQPIAVSTNMLRFDNYSGPGVTKEMTSRFAEYAKQANSLFHPIPFYQADYIRNSMDLQFSSRVGNFLVMIQTERTNSSFYVWINDEQVFASLRDINPAQPNWSYLFVKVDIPRADLYYMFIQHGDKGQGITTAIENYMERIIDRFEPATSGCECKDAAIQNIGSSLYTGLNQAWSAICGSVGVTHSIVYAIDGLYISKQRNNCEYTFYVHRRI